MKWFQSRTDIIKNSLAVVVALVVGVFGVALLVSSHAATGASLSIAPVSGSLTQGSTYSATIKVDSGTDVVNAVQASLNYDPTQLQYVSTTQGTAFPTTSAISTSTPGIVRVAQSTQSKTVSGSQTVITVNFKVLAASGSVSLSFDKNYSLVVRSSDNSDILTTTTGATLTVSGTNSGAGASMSLSPATGSVAVGSTVNVTVRENSGTVAVNSVQASVGYNSTQLQYTGLTESGVFKTVAATDVGTPGRIRVARAVQAGGNGVTGDNAIVTLSFKVLASSGTAALSLDKTQSLVVSSSANADILVGVTGASFTVTPVANNTSTLSLSPTGGTYAQGSTVSVTLKATSQQALTTVEAAINYPASELQYVSVTEGGVFDYSPPPRTDTSTAGLIDLVRIRQGGSAGVTGTNPVVTINFKVIGSSGSAALTFSNKSAIYDDSGTGNNILNLANSTPATYTITSGNPTPPPPPVGTAGLSLSPMTGSFAPNSTVSVALNATSSTAAMTTVEAALNYPASQLQFVSVSEGGIFDYSPPPRTNTATPGYIDLVRIRQGGSAGVTGTVPVVNINFKVIGTSGNAALTFAAASAIYDNSGTGNSIYNSAISTGATYTISSGSTCSASPSMPGTPFRTASTYTSVSFTWTASVAASNCTMSGYHIYRGTTAIGDVSSGTSFSDSGLTAGSNYNYTVVAFDKAGHTSPASPSTSLTTKADDQAPTTPIGVTASASSAVSVNLAWNPSTDFPNPGGVGVGGYHIYRNGATTPSDNITNGTSFTDSNVTASTTYSYTITAYDKLGNESSPSNIATAKTQPGAPSCNASPTTPTGLNAGTSTITTTDLSWTASTAANGCTLAGYHIFRGSVMVQSVSGTSFHDAGLAPNTSYNYTVQAYDTNAHTSSLSTAKTIITTADTSAPTAPTNVTANAVSGGQVTLTWTVSTDNYAVSGYRIYRGGTLLTTTTAMTHSFNDTTVSANSSYSYSVSAVDDSNNESSKTLASPNPVHTPPTSDTTAPTVPTGLKAITLTPTAVVFSWTASTDNTAVTGYHIYRNSVLLDSTTATSYSNTGLTANTVYTYTVRAYDAAGNTSGASSSLVVTTLKPIVSLVGDLNSDGVVNNFDISIMMTHWQDVNVPVKFGDINQDGVVNNFDISILLSHLGDKI